MFFKQKTVHLKLIYTFRQNSRGSFNGGKMPFPEHRFFDLIGYFYHPFTKGGNKLKPMRFFDFFNGTDKKDPAKKTAEKSGPVGLDRTLEGLATAFLQKYAPQYPGLDYSVGSLEVLERLLQDAGGFFGEMTPVQQQKITEGAGAYLFEVARKNVGGTYYWYQKLDQPVLITGQPDFETGILAYHQVRNRLKNGPEENIPAYFKGYMESVKQSRSAIII